MYLDGNLVPIIGALVGAAIAISAIFTKYRIRVEQIKADAMVRAEEVRARNQLELEKLLHQQESHAEGENIRKTAGIAYDETSLDRRQKEKERY